MRARALLLAALVAVTMACGRKAGVIAPELVEPETPGSLVASSTLAGVQLTWQRPTHYTSGQAMNDLGRVFIDRASAESPKLQFTRVGTIELTDRTRFRKDRTMEWLDATATQGGHYRYRITAVTLDGDQSAPTVIDVHYQPKETK